MEIPLPTHHTQKLRTPSSPPRPTSSRGAPGSPKPPRRPPSPPPMRRRPTRRNAYTPQNVRTSIHQAQPAVRKLHGNAPEKAMGISMLLVFVVAAFLWSQEKWTAADSIGRILPSAGGDEVSTAGHPIAPRDTSSWNFSRAATVSTFQFPHSGRDVFTDMAVRSDGRLVAVGTLHTSAGLPSGAFPIRQLIDGAGSRNFGFIAEFSPDGRTLHWLGLFGGDLLEPSHIRVAPDGSLILGARALTRLPLTGAVPSGTRAVLLNVRFDGMRVEWVHPAPPAYTGISDVLVDREGRVVWMGATRDDSRSLQLHRLRLGGDPDPIPGAERSGGFALALDTSAFRRDGHAGAFYHRSSNKTDGYDYDGPGGVPPVSFHVRGIQSGGALLELPGGDIVVGGTLRHTYRIKDQRRKETTDLFLARLTSSGDVRWSTNLYREGDSVHAPAQEMVDLAFNPATSEILVLAHQRGTRPYRLAGSLKGKGESARISWVGRVTPGRGELQHGWYLHCTEATYGPSGFPAFSSTPMLADSHLRRIAVDRAGRIYLGGKTGPRPWTSPQAWRAWPETTSRGELPALIVFNSRLDHYLYSSILSADPLPSATGFPSLVLNHLGVWLGGHTSGKDWPPGPASNWSQPDSSSDVNLGLVNFGFSN